MYHVYILVISIILLVGESAYWHYISFFLFFISALDYPIGREIRLTGYDERLAYWRDYLISFFSFISGFA